MMDTVLHRKPHSLKSLCVDYTVKNMSDCCDCELNGLIALPGNIKDRLLHKFLTSSYFWRNVDFKRALTVLTHRNTEEIDLTSTTVDDDMLKILQRCDLHKLYLARVGHQEVTSDGLIGLFSHLQHLTVLRVSHCQSVNDQVLVILAENSPQLSTLDVGGCISVTDVGLKSIAKLDHLKWVTFSGTSVTNEGVRFLVEGPSGVNLIELRLANCSRVDETIFKVIADNCPNITVLVFCYNSNPLDDSFNLTNTQKEKLKNLKQVTWTISW